MAFRIKVLVVEDDNAMAQMCAKLIRRRGHSAVIASSSQDALAIVKTAGDVDVVLSDVHMPHMNGLELLSGLREIDSHLPVVLMTGHATVLSPEDAVAFGATDYLTKPFDVETLLGRLEHAVRTRAHV